LTATPTGVAFRADVQGLRAIAVGLVVLCHAHVPGFAGGFVGVDVFFVLSGYLITGLLVEEKLQSGSIRYCSFLARRLRRLLPAMLVMLVVVMIAGSLLLTPYEMRMQAGSVSFAATWTSNFFFAFAERDYFLALQSKELFLHTWSLGVEEQFYIIWPWLILAFAAIETSRTRTVRDNMLVALAMVFLAGLALCVYLSQVFPILSFYMMPARAWQFSIGALVYVGLNRLDAKRQYALVKRLSGFTIASMSFAGLGLIIGASSLLSSNMSYPGYLALAPSIGTGLLLAAGKLDQGVGVSRVLAARPLVWIGDRSYSIYLWHWPVLILGGVFTALGSTVGIALLVLLSLLLGAASYKWVEYPVWKGRLRSTSTMRTAIASAAAIMLAISVSTGLERNVYGLKTAAGTAPGYDPRFDNPRNIYGPGLRCDTGYLSAAVESCEVGSKDGRFTAVLLGDSIGVQWAPMLTGIFTAENWQVLVLTKSACAIVDESYYYEKAGGDYEVCTQWRNAALDYIAALEPEVVIVGSSAEYSFSDSEWRDGSSRILQRLSTAADQVVLIPGTPRLSFDGPSCLEDPYRFLFRLSGGTRECEEAESDTRRKAVTANLRDVAGDFAKVSFLDLGDLVCPHGFCAAQSNDGIVVYRDQNHLTVRYVESLINDARDRLTAMGVTALPRADR
jgi:peptidoglycan/LPS O-acetylase OafA/YrhL